MKYDVITDVVKKWNIALASPNVAQFLNNNGVPRVRSQGVGTRLGDLRKKGTSRGHFELGNRWKETYSTYPRETREQNQSKDLLGSS